MRTTFSQINFNLNDVNFRHDWSRFITQNLNILFITDDRLSDTNTVYQFMNNQDVGCIRLKIDRAVYRSTSDLLINPDPGVDEAKFYNFRFQSTFPDGGLVIDSYDVIFIFAVLRGPSIPDVELETLHAWMNNGGGVFATGDHSTLGERICSKIPRVGTMRKWTNNDGVPPRIGSSRIDTNQPDPTRPGQIILNSVQRDEFPQNIKFVPYRIDNRGLFPGSRIQYPHEILCHPTLGVINVMPDHPHEGECFNVSEIDLAAKVDFGGSTSDEYPTHNGNQEKPRVIATGNTSSAYGDLLEKGEVDDKKFNMISVYDGHKANVGRVVVDSTWHHWYGMNIDRIQAAGGVNWEKIGRYFLNVAKYLAPPEMLRQSTSMDIIDTQFSYPFNEEQLFVGVSKNPIETGAIFYESLKLRWGECGVVSFVLNSICDLNPSICGILKGEIIPDFDPEFPIPPVCLSCPPFQYISYAVLGGVIRGTSPLREKLYSVLYEGKNQTGLITEKEIDLLAKKGIEQALNEFSDVFAKDLQRSLKTWF